LKTVVYIDGYNLYYGLLRRSLFKWLDLYKLFQQHVLDDQADVVEVRYYTAPVLGRMCDDSRSPQRQRAYLQALRKMPPRKVTIVEGRHLVATPYQRLVSTIPAAPDLKKVQVYAFTEKHTDVNLASDLITGAWTKAYEQAVICTNDTDIVAALSAIRDHHPHLKLGLVAPIKGHDHRKMAFDLVQQADWAKILSPVHLENSLLPDRIPGTAIRKPDEWSVEPTPAETSKRISKD
jgi:uncharacterized LabA/DUF88 family protein